MTDQWWPALLSSVVAPQLTGDLMTAPTISQACPTESYRYTESNKFKGLNKYKNTRFYHTESKEYTGSPYWELQVHLLYHTEDDIYTGLLFWFKSYTYNFFFTISKVTCTPVYPTASCRYTGFYPFKRYLHGLLRVTGKIILPYQTCARAYPTESYRYNYFILPKVSCTYTGLPYQTCARAYPSKKYIPYHSILKVTGTGYPTKFSRSKRVYLTESLRLTLLNKSRYITTSKIEFHSRYTD